MCADRVKEEAKALSETILTSSRRSRKRRDRRSLSDEVKLPVDDRVSESASQGKRRKLTPHC